VNGSRPVHRPIVTVGVGDCEGTVDGAVTVDDAVIVVVGCAELGKVEDGLVLGDAVVVGGGCCVARCDPPLQADVIASATARAATVAFRRCRRILGVWHHHRRQMDAR